MTDAEAIRAWMEHDPWTRASKELVQRIQRINNVAKTKAEKAEQEVGEALV